MPSPKAPGDGGELVLVVEHEPAVADLDRQYLGREGFTVHVEHGGRAGLTAAQSVPAVLLVLAVGLPDVDGVELYRALRARGIETPVLFVVDGDDEVRRVRALGLGPDDYLTKPFSPRELVAKARGRVRTARTGDSAPSARTYRAGEVTLDPDGRRILVSRREVALTGTEFDLLAFLMRRPGRVYTRDQLLAAVWGPVAVASTRTVDVHVAQLRAKLGEASPIRTVRGIGYAVESSRQPRPADPTDPHRDRDGNGR